MLLREGQAALDATAAAERRTRRAGVTDPDPRLILVTKAGASVELLVKLLDAYAAEPEAVAVEVLLCGPGEQEGLLRDGRADVALLHWPFDSTAGLDLDLDLEELNTEQQVLVLPAGHPLTGRSDLRLADVSTLANLPLPRWPRADGSYPDGPGPQVRNHEQLFQLIALGQTLAVLPESVQGQLRGGHTVVRLVDAALVTTLIAWPPRITSRALVALVRTATRV